MGYKHEPSRVLSRFDNFSVAFTFLSPMVGIYSLFVALVLDELGSHFPVAGALYQYSKYTVGPGYGWWVVLEPGRRERAYQGALRHETR